MNYIHAYQAADTAAAQAFAMARCAGYSIEQAHYAANAAFRATWRELVA